MAAKKFMWIFLGILAISACLHGAAIKAEAETMNFKAYAYVVKNEEVLIGDVEEHKLVLQTRRNFCVFENGEVATGVISIMGDFIKGAGSNISYSTMTFADGSTIVTKRQTIVGETGAIKGEIIKGTGRFVGIRGTHTAKTKFLPLEKGEAGRKSISEVTLTYTLPSK